MPKSPASRTARLSASVPAWWPSVTPSPLLAGPAGVAVHDDRHVAGAIAHPPRISSSLPFSSSSISLTSASVSFCSSASARRSSSSPDLALLLAARAGRACSRGGCCAPPPGPPRRARARPSPAPCGAPRSARGSCSRITLPSLFGVRPEVGLHDRLLDRLDRRLVVRRDRSAGAPPARRRCASWLQRRAACRSSRRSTRSSRCGEARPVRTVANSCRVASTDLPMRSRASLSRSSITSSPPSRRARRRRCGRCCARPPC